VLPCEPGRQPTSPTVLLACQDLTQRICNKAAQDAAAGWLYRQGLADGIMNAKAEGPEWLYLTDDGVECAEQFWSDTRAYLVKGSQPVPPAASHTVTIGTSIGPVQVAGDYARLEQNISTSQEQLRLLVTGITQIVCALVPSISGAEQAEQGALAAVRDNAVDVPALERFRDWVLSTLHAGADAAAVAAVSSATATLLLEASHLASHLA
jgi:hypothetical protein